MIHLRGFSDHLLRRVYEKYYCRVSIKREDHEINRVMHRYRSSNDETVTKGSIIATGG